MRFFQALTAIVHGFQLCFFEREIRKLAMWPWLIGAVSYVIALVAAYYLHSPIVSWFVDNPEGYWQHTLYYLAWGGVSLFLLIAALILSLVAVMVLAGVFQTSIAIKVLQKSNVQIPKEQTGVSGTIKEVGRTVTVESAKLLWIIPLTVLVVIIGIIPFIAPIALVIGAWLLAYQFLDVVLDVFRISARRRLRFAMQNWATVTLYGLSIALICSVPFVALLIPPVAVAGCAWLLGTTEWGKGQLQAIEASTRSPSQPSESAVAEDHR